VLYCCEHVLVTAVISHSKHKVNGTLAVGYPCRPLLQHPLHLLWLLLLLLPRVLLALLHALHLLLLLELEAACWSCVCPRCCWSCR
jgi:hypothetical protein